ncbi:response regulator [Aequorivita sp. F47161]|uniref:Response regulator n=1 Tax=Aequorivita vitellina TaxID=2874475 RepID=A0A9X1QY15_9FLAO|nr:response regulator [Aequorivita vitellina]MCG2419859.1 response regulator [Aequorivita vitellina]MCZ4318502.1 response regulator [Aequorivita viscosa]
MNLPNRFIVVDDDRISNLICELACRRFSSLPEIKTFLDPHEALSFIKDAYTNSQNSTPTMLFLDINMPVISGWDFLDIFNELPPHIRQQFSIYILTSSLEQRDVEKAEAHKYVKGLLSKPLSAETIEGIYSEDIFITK